jgi:hypothetical protein
MRRVGEGSRKNMIDDEIQIAITIAKEHWLQISDQTKVFLIPRAEWKQPDTAEIHSSPAEIQQNIQEHGAYRFVYLAEHDELFIGRVGEEIE